MVAAGVCQLLEDLRMGAHAERLAELGVVELADLVFVTEQDLVDFGVSTIQRRRFQDAVKQVMETDASEGGLKQFQMVSPDGSPAGTPLVTPRQGYDIEDLYSFSPTKLGAMGIEAAEDEEDESTETPEGTVANADEDDMDQPARRLADPGAQLHTLIWARRREAAATAGRAPARGAVSAPTHGAAA
eukprot:CAMPEP_0204257040 /NCGR_PEP_ID=MMETSP0468-20130131/4161_1 /ASSEMBLY_ACC=CAM_ASM_000383 /TAXON_ID=2969 /ORGANISM="Oxyrrhis marina" /LENGTH=186 /DNA_ID=CAMNT_0051231085 /DNA_START=38 /DNA_END=594 /DNA_ORIENTATION=+